MLTFTVNREVFLQGLSRVQGIVERKNTVPILSNVFLDGSGEGLRLLATDMEVSISGAVDASVKKKGAVTVSARKLFEIVKELPGESQISFQVREGNLSVIQCGASSFELKGLPAEDFPKLPASVEASFVKLDAGILREMIKRTIYAASVDETRYNLTGILFEIEESGGKGGVLRLVATDGHRLAMAEKPAQGKVKAGQSVVIPRKSFNEVRRLLEEGEDATIEVDFQKQHCVFRRDSTVLTTRLIDMAFPNYQQVIPQERKSSATMDREAVIHAIRRVSLLSSERSRAIRFAFTPEQLTVHANNPDLGTASESVPISYDGQALDVTFNARYMLDTLSSLDATAVQVFLKDELSPCLVSQKGDDGYIAVVMPMRV